MAAVDEFEIRANVACVEGIDRGGRLIQEKQPRAVEHGLRERKTRLLADENARLGPPVTPEIIDVGSFSMRTGRSRTA
jgi:hypothetical protein